MTITLQPVSGEYAVYRLEAGAEIPPMVWQADFINISVTSDEISIVTLAGMAIPGAQQVGPWNVYRVAGTLDFALTGILHSLTGPLADAEVSVFAISTFDTDYLLVRGEATDVAEKAWRGAGIKVEAQ